MKLVIDTAGDVTYVHHDEVPYAGLGSISVKRASNVEFDNATQEWVATLVETGEEIARSKRRDEAIRQEVQVIEQRLTNGTFKH